MAYRVTVPWIVKKLMPGKLIWNMPPGEKPCVYLTFDDGPHPTATPFVLEQLDKFNAKATFFCIGKNVVEHPDIYNEIVSKGHTTGNHTQHHLNGWKVKQDNYLQNVALAAERIDSKLFRPPYGRITWAQAGKLDYDIYMWDVLSADFDTTISPQQCLNNVLNNIAPGSIVVFHDSTKAWDRMSYALPRVLQHCTDKGWEIKALPKR